MTWRGAVTIDPERVVAPVNRMIFGSFVEHMGRGVYGGLFEPGHPRADEDGFRGDVLDLAREMGVTAVRYPGGNFVSGYNWEDGVGPVDERPVRRDEAWKSLEPNHFGLGEFIRWAAKAQVEPIIALNLGTRGTRSALDLLEYANVGEGRPFADLRRSHGHEEPYGIRTWCLGNELDGPWQLGHKTADEYGRLAAETARAMRQIEPDLRLVLCGSSALDLPTFGSWDRTVLEHAFEDIDLISAHAYYDPEAMHEEEFLASAVAMEQQIAAVISIADDVARERRSSKRIGIAFDEWNVWYMNRHQGSAAEPWSMAPRLCEDDYTTTDAVVVGSLLMTLLRHSDRVGLACQAQLVNTIAPIRTQPHGPAWRQTTFHPFSAIARNARGEVLDVSVDGPLIDGGSRGEVPAVDAIATVEHKAGQMMLFLINRSLGDEAAITIDLESKHYRLISQVDSLDDDAGRPKRGRLVRGPLDGRVELDLPPVSWAMLGLAVD